MDERSRSPIPLRERGLFSALRLPPPRCRGLLAATLPASPGPAWARPGPPPTARLALLRRSTLSMPPLRASPGGTRGGRRVAEGSASARRAKGPSPDARLPAAPLAASSLKAAARAAAGVPASSLSSSLLGPPVLRRAILPLEGVSRRPTRTDACAAAAQLPGDVRQAGRGVFVTAAAAVRPDARVLEAAWGCRGLAVITALGEDGVENGRPEELRLLRPACRSACWPSHGTSAREEGPKRGWRPRCSCGPCGPCSRAPV